MSVKIREAGCLSELKETKQKVMEFETQVTIYLLFSSLVFFTDLFFHLRINIVSLLNRFIEEKTMEKI